MIRSITLTAILFLTGMAGCSISMWEGENSAKSISDNTSYVNLFIGTGGHGHTYPGATMPNGMVQLSPDTRTFGWDACGGYHYSDSSILGFSHTHLSGTGIGDLGDVLFMPFTGKAQLVRGTPENPDSGYRSRFRHESEEAVPGYYSVQLDDYGIKAELTASKRAGFHRYTFAGGEQAKLIIDLKHTIHDRDIVISELKVINDREIAGYKHVKGWAQNRHVYFHAKFNTPFSYTWYNEGVEGDKNGEIRGGNVVGVLQFEGAADVVLAKVGISSVDYQGAQGNLESEISHWSFDQLKKLAHDSWKEQLSAINVQGGTKEQKAIFYTGLYHTAVTPNVFNDVDGRYRGMDQKIYLAGERNIYTVFSLWDTFRAFHPLLNIIHPELNGEFIHSLLTKYEHGGILPKWELAANYTGTMIGYHAVSVIVDAYLKGVRGYDVDKAFEAIVHASTYDTTDIQFPSDIVREKLSPKAKFYNAEMGYIPADLENESVSKALEYAYNDWCIAQMAKDLGKIEEYARYMERSTRYRKYYDRQTGFMRGVNENGQYRTPFDPTFSRHREDDYVEGNAWQWTWFVPHDVDGLVSLMGGQDRFIAKIDELFSAGSEIAGEDKSMDITGLIGQYAHGNEPSHHITHMYNFVGQPWKTQELADSIMESLYFDNPNGLSGNEDCGQMSAWYILNAMGFYSFCPGESRYSIGRPIFDKVNINLPNGAQLIIIARKNSRENRYVQSVQLNGKMLDEPFFDHSQIVDGGVLEFDMGEAPIKGAAQDLVN